MVLISIHPRFAEAIVRGEKTVEFRRRWTKREVSHLVIYATAPIKRIVAVAIIKEVVEESPAKLWKLSQAQGGGVTRAELSDYFTGLKSGFGILLETITPLRHPIDFCEVFPGFRGPQSFRFMRPEEKSEFRRLLHRAK